MTKDDIRVIMQNMVFIHIKIMGIILSAVSGKTERCQMENNQQKKSSDLNIFAFWKAQHEAWKITVIRTSLERMSYKMVLPYLSLFIILLGANKTQLGLITSLGLICSALIAPMLGQHIDRHGPKKMYIMGILILLGGYIAFAGAKIWQVGALGMFLHQMGGVLGGQSCSNICGNCLSNKDRAKGMLVCETLAAGVLGMVGPMLAGWFMVKVMGVDGAPTDPEQIRPLFYFTVLFTLISLAIIVFKLDVKGWGNAQRAKRSAIKDAFSMMKADKNCFKWILMVGVGRIPGAMIIPYVQLFATEIKGADAATLAAMTTATAVTALACGYICGIISDRFGRKMALGSTIGLYIIGLVMIMTAKSGAMLIIGSVLSGFQEISLTIAGSMQHELVPAWARGRWSGVNSFVGSSVSAAVAAIAGIIYDTIGPQWLFIIYIAAEFLIRLPLLLSLPETLKYEVNEDNFAALK